VVALTDHEQRYVHAGYVSGVYGVSGWVRVYSFTEPREQIISYSPWQLLDDAGDARCRPVVAGRRQGKGVVARLEGVDDRDTAAGLVGMRVLVDRRQFAAPGDGEYYWADLVGLEVCTEQGESLGVVDHLIETGANDVLVVTGTRRRLIPFVVDRVVKSVDERRIVVDWDTEG